MDIPAVCDLLPLPPLILAKASKSWLKDAGRIASTIGLEERPSVCEMSVILWR